jgi:tRNA modification GTPase
MSPPTTIAAVSTPPGASGIGIVRVSGPRARAILRALFRPVGGNEGAPRALRLGWIVDGDARVDQALAAWFPAPATYTREETVELHCHGGPVVLARVLSLVLREGAVLAGPGEFTRRAYENGRIDLAQAEAVIDVIRATSAAGLALSQAVLAGGLSEKIRATQGRVAGVLARAEAHIDFPDDDLGEFPVAEAAATLGGAREEAARLASTYDDARLLSDGVRVVLAGRPNVGKSSLLNALLARERAIVTPYPGTTRDVLEEPLTIDGVPFRLADVAGWREASEPIEQEGLRRAREQIDAADLVVLVCDASEPKTEDDENIVEYLKTRGEPVPRPPYNEDTSMSGEVRRGTGPPPVVVVLNKTDIVVVDLLSRWKKRVSSWSLGPVAETSAITGAGLDDLRQVLKKKALSRDVPASGEVLVTRFRHRQALDRSAAALGSAIADLTGGIPLDLVATHLREAADALGEIVGAVTTDEILDRIFGEFCVGK